MIWDNEEHIPLYHMIPTLHLTKTWRIPDFWYHMSRIPWWLNHPGYYIIIIGQEDIIIYIYIIFHDTSDTIMYNGLYIQDIISWNPSHISYIPWRFPDFSGPTTWWLKTRCWRSLETISPCSTSPMWQVPPWGCRAWEMNWIYLVYSMENRGISRV